MTTVEAIWTSETFDRGSVVRAVTMIMGTVVGLTFLFGFGNVLNLALRLGVPIWVAPLVAPAVDLSILGLLLAIRHLAVNGARPEQLRPARRLLVFSSVVTLALNIADPLIVGDVGKAAFDAVGPLLLIGWAEVGPELLRALSATERSPRGDRSPEDKPAAEVCADAKAGRDSLATSARSRRSGTRSSDRGVDGDLVRRARQADVLHREVHQRPISAETLRKQLGIGTGRSRALVALLRSE